MLVPTGTNVLRAVTVEEVQYGDVVLDSAGKVWERQRNHFQPDYEWHTAAGFHARYSNYTVDVVAFPVLILARLS